MANNKTQRTKHCKYCRAEMPYSSKFCPNCGKNQNINSAIGAIVTITIVVFVVIVIAIICLSTSGSNDSGSNNSTSNAPASASSSEMSSESSGVSDTNQEPAASETTESTDELTIEPSTLYEGNDVIIQTTDLTESNKSYEIGLYFENNSDLNLSLAVHSYAVNGIMSSDQTYVSYTKVAAGKKATATLSITKSWLNECGIDQMKYIDILFWAYDNDKSYKSFETDVVKITTNFYDGDIEYEPETVIYDNDGIVVEQLELTDSEYKFAIINNTGTYFNFDMTNTSINDWTYDTGIQIYNDQVLDSCMMISTLSIDPDFMNTNSIDSIESLEFALDIRPLEDYFNEFTTDVISAYIE